MSARSVFLLAVLLAVPAFTQQPNISRRINQRIDAREKQISQVVDDPAAAERGRRAARLQSLHQDAAELSALSASLQSDLQDLGKGLLAKDLNSKLKKMEKLSKKLRQEMNP